MKKASQSKMIVYTKDARAVDAKKKGATVQLVASSVRDGAKIVYSVEKPNKGITVSSNGKVTVKKGLPLLRVFNRQCGALCKRTG